jgi:nucleoside phosphorylase
MKPSIPPLRLDFVVLAINDAETSEAQAVLGLSHQQEEDGLIYFWGQVPHQDGTQVTTALVSFDDKQGPTEAVQKAASILRILHPQYILILGTAGGLQRATKEIKDGDVIVSYIIHYGTFKSAKRTTFRALPVVPPSAELYSCAKKVSRDSAWKEFIKVNPPEVTDPTVVFKEIASTGINLGNLKQPILRHVRDNFPRTAAVEMEAGGVASYLFEAASHQKVPGYIVIKGISDIVDRPKDESPETNQEERDRWRSYASNASAAFARALISSFRPATRVATAIERFRPNSLQTAIKINHGCSGVFYNVQPEEYSELAAYHLRRVSSHSPEASPQFFTVCAYNPKALWEIARERFWFAMRRRPTDSELVNWTLRQFKHFTIFKDHAIAETDPNPNPSCARILLLDDFTDWTSPDNLQQQHWDFFKKLTEGVPCWGIDRRSLPNVLFLTDYVIIGADLVFNYYHESFALVVTELSHPSVSRDVLSLERMFYHHQAGDPFRALVDLDAEATNAFEKRSQI